MKKRKKIYSRIAILISMCSLPYLSFSQDQAAVTKDPLSFSSGKVEGKFYATAVASAVAEFNNYWNLASVYAPGYHFAKNRNWYEGYLKSGFNLSFKISDDLKLYGGASIVASGTAKKDIFDQGNSGRILPENAYLGIEYKLKKSSIDLSVGQQNFILGTGMLISSGAGNGFERGAVTLMPRTAWKMSGLAKFKSKYFSANGFILDYNGLDAPNNNYDRLAGIDVEFKANKILKQFGLAYINVLNSAMVYPKGLTIIENARKGIQVMNGFAEINPFEKSLPTFSMRMEYAYEWKNSINMGSHGGAISVSNMFTKLPWTPKLKYSFRTFSGDNPNTDKLERFDPLFYNGSPDGWASGGNASFTFYNSNVNAHIIELALYPSQKDIFQLFYWNLRADKLNSPLQFGQTARTGHDGISLLVGVEDHRLANDFYFSYTRIINSKFIFSGGIAASVPTKGLKLLAPGIVSTWTGGFLSFIFNM